MRRRRGERLAGGCRYWVARAVGVVTLIALTAVAVGPALAANKIDIDSLSNRPDKISGGDILVRVRVPAGTVLDAVTVKLNNADVTGTFWQDTANHALMGLVTGLKLGQNSLNATASHANAGALRIVNYPLQGPVFSGPREEPFFCQTHQFRVYPNPGPFFSPAQLTDPCVEATRVDYLYRNTTSNAFLALPAGPLPADVRMTTTTQGHTVPYIVRLETGVINRAIYQIAILDDPTVAGPDLQNHADPGWNNRLIYTFGGGCGGGHYIQGSSTGGVLIDAMLSRGFAVASSSLNVLGNNCNFVTSAETLMMVKEHFIETFGPPLYTMGFGCSGGSIQQHLIGDNYPGLLDGLTPSCSFPDVAGATTFDARLLYDYYNFKDKGVAWTEDQIRQVSGFGTYGHIVNQGTSWAARIDPVPNRPNYTNPAFSWLYNNIVPLDVRYVPGTNPTGARATTWDHVVNLLGEGANGFARRPLDNVGIQYGLGALNAGQISKEQFLDLNEKIGGLDIDANFTKQRMVADPQALRSAYQTGFVTNFGFGLANVPILDWDQIYSDLNPGGDVHMKFHHFSVRERLRKANGNADNQVIWTGGDGARGTFVSTQVVLQMDAWLTALKADTSSDTAPVKVARAKPSSLVDGCWMGGATPTFTAEPQIFGGTGTSVCNTDHPAFPFPRYVAGAPLVIDVIKCQLRAINLENYAVSFTPAEVTRLRSIFPTGVCDWSKPGVGQTDPLSTWITYTGVGTYNRDNH
jgi:hypothetical protein